MMNWLIAAPLRLPYTASAGRGFLQLDVLPRIGVAAGGEAREHVLPFRRGDARPDRIDEGVAEHRHEIIILEDLALDLLGQFLALGAVDRGEVLVELGVEVSARSCGPGR